MKMLSACAESLAPAKTDRRVWLLLHQLRRVHAGLLMYRCTSKHNNYCLTLAAKFAPCPKCGYVKTKYNPTVPPQGALYKNEGTGLILSIVLGLFCLNGIGQIYAGKVGRGIAIMVGSWVLIVVGVLTMGIGLIAYLAIFIWQIFDTKKLCREFNEYVSQNGRPPW